MTMNNEDLISEEQVKKVMLDYSEVNPNCPDSLRKYDERCEMVGELYNGYKNYMNIIAERDTKPCYNMIAPQYQVGQRTMGEIERLISYKDEYIG